MAIQKFFGLFLIKFLALGLIILTGISNTQKIFHDEILSPDRLNNRIKAFNAWYEKLNPTAKVEAKLGEDKNLHLVAKAQIKAEESYLTINRNLTIHADLIYNTKIGSFVKDLEETYGYDDLLNMVLYLVHEMGNPESEFKPYFDILPRQLDNLAFKYWERKGPIEEELIHTPFLSKKIHQKIEKITYLILFNLYYILFINLKKTLEKLVDYKIHIERKAQSIADLVANKTTSDIFDRDLFNVQNLEWAMIIIDTRGTQIGYENVLAPMLDLVNIKESPKNPTRTMKLKFEENNLAEVKSQSDVAKGAEVFENLPLSSDHLLLTKNVVNENNFHDCYSFIGNFDDRSSGDGLNTLRNHVFARYFLFDENEKM